MLPTLFHIKNEQSLVQTMQVALVTVTHNHLHLFRVNYQGSNYVLIVTTQVTGLKRLLSPTLVLFIDIREPIT